MTHAQAEEEPVGKGLREGGMAGGYFLRRMGPDVQDAGSDDDAARRAEEVAREPKGGPTIIKPDRTVTERFEPMCRIFGPLAMGPKTAAPTYCTAASARRTLPLGLGAIACASLSAAALVNQVVCSGEERLAPEIRGQDLMRKAQINLAHLVEPLQLRVAEPKLQAGHVILELGEPSRAQNRDEGVAALPDPIEGHLRRRATNLLRHLLDCCRDGQRLLIHANKGRRIAAGWLCSAAGRTALAVLARQHAAAQRRPYGHA